MSAQGRAKSLILHVVINGFWYLTGILGTFYGMAWAFNIFAFMSCVIFSAGGFIAAGMLAATALGKPIFALPTPPLPIWLDLLLDGIIALVAVAFGHWFIGALILVQIIFYDFIFSPTTKPKQQEVSS